MLYIGAVDGIIDTFIDNSKVNKWSTDDMNLRLEDMRYNEKKEKENEAIIVRPIKHNLRARAPPATTQRSAP